MDISALHTASLNSNSEEEEEEEEVEEGRDMHKAPSATSLPFPHSFKSISPHQAGACASSFKASSRVVSVRLEGARRHRTNFRSSDGEGEVKEEEMQAKHRACEATRLAS
jgi:hypothetical protein